MTYKQIREERGQAAADRAAFDMTISAAELWPDADLSAIGNAEELRAYAQERAKNAAHSEALEMNARRSAYIAAFFERDEREQNTAYFSALVIEEFRARKARLNRERVARWRAARKKDLNGLI